VLIGDDMSLHATWANNAAFWQAFTSTMQLYDSRFRGDAMEPAHEREPCRIAAKRRQPPRNRPQDQPRG
jgi:hypothetical protein